jgi:signal transduction histidine kinase
MRDCVNLQANIVRNNRRPTDFIDDAAHDLHTPLNVIIGMCRVLERGPEPLTGNQKDSVARIERNARALLKSVNELLGRLRADRQL